VSTDIYHVLISCDISEGYSLMPNDEGGHVALVNR